MQRKVLEMWVKLPLCARTPKSFKLLHHIINTHDLYQHVRSLEILHVGRADQDGDPDELMTDDITSIPGSAGTLRQILRRCSNIRQLTVSAHWRLESLDEGDPRRAGEENPVDEWLGLIIQGYDLIGMIAKEPLQKITIMYHDIEIPSDLSEDLEELWLEQMDHLGADSINRDEPVRVVFEPEQKERLFDNRARDLLWMEGKDKDLKYHPSWESFSVVERSEGWHLSP
ncbi:hypothetical protein EJ08DRAFT_651228 [Tothia fuscella]|uniref:Uncharacterized protein n=1 Tax=Tothia fuscella TaxID=1048955 RepID=A0A9P4TX01_9PEZI|nr:hypothetical protein EJ08DRAFT_651228 [Tothia fuscella]